MSHFQKRVYVSLNTTYLWEYFFVIPDSWHLKGKGVLLCILSNPLHYSYWVKRAQGKWFKMSVSIPHVYLSMKQVIPSRRYFNICTPVYSCRTKQNEALNLCVLLCYPERGEAFSLHSVFYNLKVLKVLAFTTI